MCRHFAWHEVGSLKVQLAVFGFVWLISVLLFQLNMRNFTIALTAFFFATNSIYQIYAKNNPFASTESEANNKLFTLVNSRKPIITPNIYLLVYDSYVGNETMSGYGMDNESQEQYLIDFGFKMYPHTYSLGGNSLATMSRVLNASTDFYGNLWRGVSGDGVVQNLLKGFGYKTYGIFPSDFFFRGNPPSYDYSFPSRGSSANLLTKAVFTGEFQFDMDFDKISREQFVKEKERILSGNVEGPMFLYSHSNLPGHSQISGTCLPNEVDLFHERLERANREMRQDIATIIKNDPNAIIIVAGDHGPHLTKNCTLTGGVYEISEITRLDIQDRFGAFLAIRWPTSEYEKFDDITTLQDLFPAIFAYLFRDPMILDAQVEPIVLDTEFISGATVIDGIIQGGLNDGEPLFIEITGP